MGFRRFGGDIETSRLGGSARFTGVAFAIAAFGGCTSYAGGSFFFFVLSIFMPLCILLLGTFLPINPQSSIKLKRHNKHVGDAKIYFQKRQYEQVLESIRKAKIYNTISDDLKELESISKNKTDKEFL